MKLTPLVVSFLSLALAACASDGAATNGSGDGPASTGSAEEPIATVVDLGGDATAALARFIEEKSMILADVVVVDMSRKPFLAATTFAFEKDKVRRTESVDPERGLLEIVLENMTGDRTRLVEIPHVRIGGGLEIAGLRKVVLRYWTAASVERPVHFVAVASGTAVYKVGPPQPERKAGHVVRVHAQIQLSGSDYRFEKWVENEL